MEIHVVHETFGGIEYFAHREHAEMYAQTVGGEVETVQLIEDAPTFNTTYNIYGEMDEKGKFSIRHEENKHLHQPNPVEYFSSVIDENGTGEGGHGMFGYVNVSGGDKKLVQKKFDGLAVKLQRMAEARNG